jgi:putative ABC transport system permease protein
MPSQPAAEENAMFGYYLKLGLVNLRRSPVLTALMIATLAIGVAASMSTLVVLTAMSGNPIPHKSERLIAPLLDNFADGDRSGNQAPTQMSFRDTEALLAARPAARQTAVYGINPSVDSGRPDLAPFLVEGIAVTADFFSMFEVPLAAGNAWSAEDDARGAQVAVIGRGLAARVFGQADPVGQRIRLGEHQFSVVGVSDTWEPLPKYYRLVGSNSFASFEEVFVPWRTAMMLELDPDGSVNCSANAGLEPGFAGLKNSECVWMQYWAELESPAARAAFDDFLVGYVAEQRRLGRFPRDADDVVRSFDVMQWLAEREVVGDDSRLQTWLAFGFLLVCLVNTVGLLLAKYSARSGEIGVRRALGAPKAELFKQYLTESAVVGLVGGLAGLGLTFAALWVLAQQSDAMAQLARMDPTMLAVTLLLAVAAALLAGLLPTWRACQVVPAVQLKTQ